MEAFNASISFDKRMFQVDVTASIAYSAQLLVQGLINEHEARELERGLKQVAHEWRNNSFKLIPSDEDIHTANERRLGEIVGTEISGKLHTGRSRNDQVATDFRMYVRDACLELSVHVKQLIGAVVVRAEKEIDVLVLL
jgi:argininosuccinate lyase